MSVRLVSDRGYVLHSRPYRESSALVELFTQTHGRVGAVARGARGVGRRARAVQPFVCMALSWDGAGELRNLRHWESERALWMTGEALTAAMYLNELLMRLLAREDPHAALFAAYHDALPQLQPHGLEPVLRRFEHLLLDELGYGVSFTEDANGTAILEDQHYRLVDHQYFSANANGVLRGADLLSVGAGDYRELSARRAAKRIFRELLAAQLGPKPLLSRQLLSGRVPTSQTLRAVPSAASVEPDRG